jgi:hypothetical protein
MLKLGLRKIIRSFSLNVFIRENTWILMLLPACLYLHSIRQTAPGLLIMRSLSDNAKYATPGQLGTLGSLMGAATWGAVQNRISPTAPSPAGPGLIDTAKYLFRIGSAGSPEEANRAAARNIYNILGVPGMEKVMNPMVDSMLNLGED